MDNNSEEDYNGYLPGNIERADDGTCSLYDSILALSLMPRPFGVVWSLDKIEEFLTKRGYLVITRYTDDDEEYKYAVKPDEDLIPDNGKSNIMETFRQEVEGIMFNWLLKIAK